MKGYALFEKGRIKPIAIGIETFGEEVYVLVFSRKKDLLASIELESWDEVRQIVIDNDGWRVKK